MRNCRAAHSWHFLIVELKPQSPWDTGHVGSSCALGGAADVVGYTIKDGGEDGLLAIFFHLGDTVPSVEEIPAGIVVP